MAKSIDRHDVSLVIAEWTHDPTDPVLVQAATRLSMDWFAQQHPGRAVEVRVPPIRAIQILGGTTHRRGTPPAVVEMSVDTWLSLFTQEISWSDAIHQALVLASGERSNLAALFDALA